MNKQTWRLITPSVAEIVTYLLSSATLLAFVNSPKFVERLDVANDVSFAHSLDEVLRDFLSRLDSGNLATLSTMVFWMIVGMIVYILGWTVSSFIHATRNDIALASAYIHPSAQSRYKTWYSALARAFIRIVSALAIVVWFVVVARIILPGLSLTFFVGVVHYRNAANLISAVIAVPLLAFCLYFFVVLLRCMFLRRRLLDSSI